MPFRFFALALLVSVAARAADPAPLPVLEVSEMGLWSDNRVAIWGLWGSNTSSGTTVPTGLGDVVAVAASYDSAYALKSDGTVISWNVFNGPPSLPTGLTGVVAIAASDFNALALKGDGTVVTAGQNSPAPPVNLTGVVAIAAGASHGLALRNDGTVAAWGWNDSGQATVPAGLSGVTAIAAGDSYSVALKADGTLVGWGLYSYLNLSWGTGTTLATGLQGVVSIAASYQQLLLLTRDGTVLSWEPGGVGTLGLPSGLTDVTAITSGNGHSMALKRDGSVVAWGNDGVGQTDIPVNLRATAIAASNYYSLAVPVAGTSAPVEMGMPAAGGSSTRSFRVTNSSVTTPLTGLSAVVASSNTGAFAILTPLPDRLAPGQSVEFVVSYTPVLVGVAASSLSLFSGGSAVPVSVMPLNASAALPHLEFEGSTYPYPPTTTVDCGIVPTGGSSTKTLVVQNWGLGRLTSLVLTVDGAAADDFTVGPLLFTSVPPTGLFQLQVQFKPGAQGARNAVLHLASNDPAPGNEKTIALVGAGNAVTLSVAGGGPLSQPTAGISLGSAPTGTTFDRSFTLTNSSSITFTGLRLGITGTNAGQVTVLQDLPGTLSPGASATFTVQLTPLVAGQFFAVVSVLGDQATTTPSAIQFSALVQAAQISVISAAGDALAQGIPEVFKYWNDFGLPARAAAPGAVAVARGDYHIVALMQDGTVFASGTAVPQGLAGVTAIAAGCSHSVALKGDGTVIAWGTNDNGESSVPAGLEGVTAIAAGYSHTLALKNDGTVIAWGTNTRGESKMPAGLRGVTAIAAGPFRSVALKSDGTIVNWGAPASVYGAPKPLTPIPPPASLRNVTALAIGKGHTVALKGDGTVVAWGSNGLDQTRVPAGLTGVVAIAAGMWHTLALKSDGTVVGWGAQANIPIIMTGVTSISAFDYVDVALANGGAFVGVPVGKTRDIALTIGNTGTALLGGVQAVVDGPDASQFSIPIAPKSGPYAYDPGGQDLSTCSVRFAPTTGGPKTATLRIYSNDPTVSPFNVPLTGYGSQVAVKAAAAGGGTFTYNTPATDPLTGLLLQKISFTNTSALPLDGLRLVLSRLEAGITVYSSSAGDKPGTLDVLYTNPIAPGETVNFTLAYFDPQRRSAATNPIINAEELKTPEPAPGPVNGTLIKLLSIRDTPEGPLLEWSTAPDSQYVVEYSDDHGTTWHSAVHRLGNGGGSRMFWIDRGQPETQTKPLNKAARMYRVKRV